MYALAYLLLLLFGLKLRPNKQEHTDREHRQPNKESGREPLPVIASLSTPVAISVKTETEERKTVWQKLFRGLEMLGIAAVVVYTVLTYYILKDTDKTLKQTADQFRAEQRAWIVTTVDSDDPEIGKDFKIILKIRNPGKTVAVNTRICQITEFVPMPFTLPTLRECQAGDWTQSGGLIPPIGEGSIPAYVNPHTVTRQTGLTKEEFLSLMKPSVIAVHYGNITYDDIFGCQHWTTFCQLRNVAHGEAIWQLCNKGNDPEPETACKKQ